ncbi:aspartate--tRNA ligase [Bartonella sp. DGB1]|uniref:aspartate--tRNA ligase n=1 Tax=Bartonella sp. DGB1 TaxID=3239807 RepID=UPI003525F981
MHRYRSHTCGDLRITDTSVQVRLSGWVHRVRDHGGLLFVDLRDHYGLIQLVINPDSNAFNVAESLRNEWVICIDGTVTERSDETKNPQLVTGDIEIFVDNIEVLSKADELPLPVFGEPEYPENIRLAYRFLDLRRETLHKNIMLRLAVIASIRKRMQELGFNEFATPILTSSSPEGARDFLVPSRIHPGKFYALPQAPQQYKQLIMMAGFDKYFQIAPCFRDEDPRADRFPGEFYQLDVEMSFVEQEDVLQKIEPVMASLFEEFANGKKVSQPFKRLTYDEAISKYGSDKPDLRNPIIMESVSEHFKDSGFKIFANILATNEKAAVWAIPAKKGGSRAFCDRMNSWAQKEGEPGLGYIFWRLENGKLDAAGPIAKNIGEERTAAIAKQLNLGDGDACFFVAGDPKKFYNFAGKARTKIGEELNLIDENLFELAWITDFPFYEWNEDEDKLDFGHNPFSMPQGGVQALQDQDPLSIKSLQYDLVCNGYEIASGSIRNHIPEVMVAVFEKMGINKAEVEKSFGALYRAFHYGAPPHGGIAAGIDRIVMLLAGVKNLREIALFPMSQQAVDLLMGAPSVATPTQLRELNIRPLSPVTEN